MFPFRQRRIMSSMHKRVQQSERIFTAKSVACLICKQGIRDGIKMVGHDGIKLCDACYEQIPWITELVCHICGRYELCPDCGRRELTYFMSNRSAVRYDQVMKQWLGLFKYRKNERLAPLFVAMLYPVLLQLLKHLHAAGQTLNLLTYIPLSQQRMEERGFNQAELIALGLSQLTNIPCSPLIDKPRHTFKQSYKNRADRLRDLADAFAWNNDAVLPVSRVDDGSASAVHPVSHVNDGSASVELASSHLVFGRCPLNIALIDDVYTTGSTLNEAAKVIDNALRDRAIQCHIYGLTWAR